MHHTDLPTITDQTLSHVDHIDDPNTIYVNTPQEPVHTRPSRTKHLPSRYKEFVGLPPNLPQCSTNLTHFNSEQGMYSTATCTYPIQNYITYDNLSPSHRAYVIATSQIPVPCIFSQSVSNPNWCKAM